MIVHLNGWPGVGKGTVGAVVAHRLGARFVHNHVLHDVAFACAGRGDPARWPLYESVRAAAYDVLRNRPGDETFVMTNALCEGVSREVIAWEHVVELAVSRAVPLVPVVLTARLEELERRVASPGRLATKLKDPARLRAMVAEHRLQVPAVRETLVLDVGDLSPEAAAETILAHVERVRERCPPATSGHLETRRKTCT